MAAKCPPNLDDGELWLPSELIPDLGSCRRSHHHQPPPPLPPSDLAYIEALAHHLAALGFVDRRHHPLKQSPFFSPHPIPLPAGRLGPLLERDLSGRLMYERLRPPPAATGAFFPGPEPQFQPGVPVQFLNRHQPVDGSCSGPVRGRVLQTQPSRFIPPVRRRECVGTGVFLPRVGVDTDGRRKPQKLEGVKGGEQYMQQTRITTEVGHGRTLQTLNPELELPQDWTY